MLGMRLSQVLSFLGKSAPLFLDKDKIQRCTYPFIFFTMNHFVHAMYKEGEKVAYSQGERVKISISI